MGHKIVGSNEKPDIQLSFIRASKKVAPIVQRLDGVHFDSMQNWKKANQSIHKTYKDADAIIFQSEFDKNIAFNFIGKHKNVTVIHNGTDLSTISKIEPFKHEFLNDTDVVWCCSSRWTNRPNKRLKDNVDYFLENADHEHAEKMIVIGPDSNGAIKNNSILYLGNITWEECISVYKRANYFVHLAFVDHCPNVVIDARACGCQITCASCSGTKEIAGFGGVIVKDMDWNMKDPIDVKHPPELDFCKIEHCLKDSDISIEHVAEQYIGVFQNVKMV